ncbi:MAG TPA: hypothetical protein VFM27_06150, partial [Acidimicrobiales bacterium]|nr:hypothetical protein [Acidimicrobiales bacterium]
MASLAAPDGGATQAGIVGPGMSDAAAVVDAVVDRLVDRGTPVRRLSGRRLERDHAFAAVHDLVEGAVAGSDERSYREALLERLAGGAAALVIEDAQWLDAESLRVVVGVAERAAAQDVRLVVAHRPAAGDPTLAALDALLGRSQPLVALGPLDESEVRELAAVELGTAVDDRLVEALHDYTGGMPALACLVLAAWTADGTVSGGRLSAAPGSPSPSLVAALRAEVDQLTPAARTVLGALSAGADLDDELLAATTDLAPDRLGEAVDALRSAGLVTP